MEATRIEQVIAALKGLFNRDLTDEEIDSVAIWDKCRDMQAFVENFPNEWKTFKDTLRSYANDYTDKWESLKRTHPDSAGDITGIHAQAYAVTRLVDSFIEDIESAPRRAAQVPEIVREGFQQMQAMPKEALG